MAHRRSLARLAVVAAAALAALPAWAQIKIAYVDPLSGGGATIGEHGLKHLQYLVEVINARGGVAGGQKLEAVAYDNKGSPQESLVQVQKAIDAGVRFITQGNGSGAAIAISEFVAKYNERNPGKEVLYFNYAAVDPSLTNERCNFWHFRLDINADMKMEALTAYMAKNEKIKKVYLINQDYAFGQAVSKAAKEMLTKKRPDVQIVGDDLHPLGKVKDFAPYIAKIKASGADSVITGNWGADLALLVKAGKDAGLNVEYYTYYSGIAGGPSAIGEAGVGHVRQVSHWFSNVGDAKSDAMVQQYQKRFPDSKDDFVWLAAYNAIEMLVKAMEARARR